MTISQVRADRPTSTTSDRPWGSFERLTLNETSTVKVIVIAPDSRLSLQRHRNRSELWQILDGPVDVEVDDRTWSAPAGEQVWVPQGATHRMGNSGAASARVLEVAFGTFDEDDIERLADDYAR